MPASAARRADLEGLHPVVRAAVVGELQETAQLIGEAGAQGDLGVIEPVAALVGPRAAGFEHAGQPGGGVALVGMQGHQAETAGNGQAVPHRRNAIVGGSTAGKAQQEEAGKSI